MSVVVDVTEEKDEALGVVDLIESEDDITVQQGQFGEGPPLHFHGYRRGRELGRGISGKVFLCFKKGIEGGFAVKAIDLKRARIYMQLSPNVERDENTIHREMEILKRLPPHPNIVQLVDAIHDVDWLFLVFELVGGGDLFTVLTNREPPRLLEREAAFVLLQLVDGLAFLHAQSVIHRDLKLENILVSSESRDKTLVLYRVKIADFGLSKVVGVGRSEAKSMVGTRPYTAQEVLMGASYDFSSDLWSLGVLLFVMLVGHFLSGDLDLLENDVAKQAEVDRVIGKISVSDAARSVLSGLLQLVPQKRWSLEAVQTHAWMQDASSLWSDSVDRLPKRKRSGDSIPDVRSQVVAPQVTGFSQKNRNFATMSSLPVAVGTVDLVAPRLAPACGLEPEKKVGALRQCVDAGTDAQKVLAQQPQHASAIGEWLAHIYSVSKGDAVPTSLAPTRPILTAGPASLTAGRRYDNSSGVRSTSPLADVMQIHTVLPVRLTESVIGKAGVHLRQVAATVGCKLWVVAHEGTHNCLVVIVGTYAQCGIVQELLHGRVANAIRAEGCEVAYHTEVVLLVRAEAAGVVIGKQGFMLQKIRKESGATLMLMREQIKGQRPCILGGSLQSILKAESHIFDLVKAVPVAAVPAMHVWLPLPT